MPLRDVLVVSIVIALAILTLRRPWIGVMNWTWLSIMNPHRYTWSFAYSAPLAALAAASTLLALLFTKEKRSPLQGAPTVWLLVLAIWITVAWLMGNDPAGDYWQWNKVMKIYLMTFVALALLHTKHHIMAYAWVTVGSLGILAAKGGVFTVLTGGAHHVYGPAESFIEDNNDFALATIIAIPMLHFLQLQLKKGWQRHFMSMIMLLCVASALGSQSRGALLGLVAVGAVFWWRSKKKGFASMVILVSLLAVLPIMPEAWWERMRSIQTYAQDESAMGRINAWHVALQVAKNNFFGGGMSYQKGRFFRMYGKYGREYNVVKAAHSIYFQILGNHGFGGLLIYLIFWTVTLYYAGRLRRLAQDSIEAKWAGELGAMVQASLVGFAVGGAFLSLQYFDLPYNLMVMVVLATKWVESRAWETEPSGSFLEHAGLGKHNKSRVKV